MDKLKTTAEERAALRDIADDTSAWSIGRDTKANMGDAMDDIDTLLAEVQRIRELLNDLEGQDTDHVAPCPAAHSEAYRCRCDLAARKELFAIVRGLP